MVGYYKKFSLVRVRENWFGYDPNFSNFLVPSASMHVKNANGKKIPGVEIDSYTIENDLTLSEDEIFGNLQKSYRQQIKNAEAEGITWEFHNDIDGFVSFFNEMAKTIKVEPTSRQRIEEMGDLILLSYAKINGNVLVAHSHIVDKEFGIVRAHHSAGRRLDENFDRNLIGRANKFLHYKEMMYFKNQGFKVYDFGGYTENTTNPALLGINEFKLNFGGQKVVCKNYFSKSFLLMRKVAITFGLIPKE